MDENLKLWDVLDGPTHVDKIFDDVLPDPDDGAKYRLICKVEIDGHIEESAFWFEDKEDAKNWVSHFSSKIDPIEIQQTKSKKE